MVLGRYNCLRQIVCYKNISACSLGEKSSVAPCYFTLEQENKWAQAEKTGSGESAIWNEGKKLGVKMWDGLW